MKPSLRSLLFPAFLFLSSPLLAQQNALNFDGVNDYVSFPVSSLPNYTIEFWVRFTGTTTAGQNLVVYTDSQGPNSHYSHQIYTDASGHFLHYTSDGSITNTVTGTTVAALNTWYHIAATGTTNGMIRLYVNGVQDGTPGSVGAFWSAGDRIQIGNTSYLGSSYFQGTMDEVRVWDHELCSTEINASMSGELLNPTTQSGLHRYYKLNQGTVGSNNSSVTTLSDASAAGTAATPYNFAMLNGSSNFVSGAPAVTGTLPASYNAWDNLATSTSTTTVNVAGSLKVASNCALIARMSPRVGVPLAGNVTATVAIDATTKTHNGDAYVRRHYHIEPAANANTSRANLILYFTQADFDAFNAVRGALPSLPTSPSDVANAGNLRITQFHGIPSGGYAPENYPQTWGGSGPTRVLITPTSINYNTNYNRWDVTIAVTGFSGFYASTTGTPLPVGITDFAAELRQDRSVRISWNAAMSGAADAFDVQRSNDGSHFETIQKIGSTAGGKYAVADAAPAAGENFYRLRTTDGSGASAYSATARVFVNAQKSTAVAPVPARDRVVVTTTAPGSTAVLTNLQGQELMRVALKTASTSIDIHQLAAGVYLLRLSDGDVIKVVKE